MNPTLNRLDRIVHQVLHGDDDAAAGLSTAERLYVALAACRTEWLVNSGYTIPAALGRIGPEWTAELVARWEYRA
ncbi:hypothetical protein BI364_10400 [Acidihalobacter yilgarnensis]|uniref:Uncharacterized protein n=1 Tax=Acidihalobacter yilgarnensis TaxID=2819280 RepID=A0A1D8IPB3_9GAMM|nr:hypothetical protein [Acidihalobacter yilgarnensis]AOU98317.1 hypothetical protein BI364_10400 [Acidihalobacter yilgarnensis]